MPHVNSNADLLRLSKLNDFGGCLDALEKGASVNFQHNGGPTPLMWAVCNGNIELTQLLLINGARVDLIDRSGKDVFWIAEEFDRPEITLLLQSWTLRNQSQ